MTNLIASIEARIAAAQSVTKTHASIITYNDGSEQRIDHASVQSAEAYLRSYRPLVGNHEYVSRKTGAKISIVSCEVVCIA
ncbi:MAG: hypothetical protein ACOH2M_29635 [Cypionkella sp.]